MVEVKGLSTGVVAANIASQTAAVTVAGFGYLHDGQVMVTVRGSVDSVQAAVDAVTGRLAGAVVRSKSLIPRPDQQIEALLDERYVAIGSCAGAPPVRGRGRWYDSTTSAGESEKSTATKKAAGAKKAATKRTQIRREPDGSNRDEG